MTIRIAKVIQTTDCVPVQWNAWTDTGQYLYMRYRQGRGSVTAHPNPDYLKWDPTVRPLIEWDDETDGYGITLEDFLAASGLTLTRYARLRAWLRRFLDRWGR